MSKKFEIQQHASLERQANTVDIGMKNPKVLYQHCTRYFPKFTQNGINKGYPWIVKNKMQGKYKNTYYIGSSVCFEAVECVIEYNLELLNMIKV